MYCEAKGIHTQKCFSVLEQNPLSLRIVGEFLVQLRVFLRQTAEGVRKRSLGLDDLVEVVGQRTCQLQDVHVL